MLLNITTCTKSCFIFKCGFPTYFWCFTTIKAWTFNKIVRDFSCFSYLFFLLQVAVLLILSGIVTCFFYIGMEQSGSSLLSQGKGRKFKSCSRNFYSSIVKRILNESEWIKIVKISKQESVELQKLGYKFGNEGAIHKSKSRYPKYYLTESERALFDLEKIRKSSIIVR